MKRDEKNEMKKQALLDQILDDEQKQAYNDQIVRTAEAYCYCRGLGSQDLDDFYVGCENEDKCPNGGWYHWKCVPSLLKKTKIELEELTWKCPECVKMDTDVTPSKQSMETSSPADIEMKV